MGWGQRSSRVDAQLLTALDRFLARRTTGNLEALEAALVDYRARTTPGAAVQVVVNGSGPGSFHGTPGPGPGVIHQVAQEAYALGRRDERRRL